MRLPVDPMVAVEVAERGGEVDAGGIDETVGHGLKPGADGEKFAAYGSGPGIQVPRVHEIADKIGLQQHVGIER